MTHGNPYKNKSYEDGYKDGLRDIAREKNIHKLILDYSFGLKGFWYHNKRTGKRDYKVIPTRYGNGYLQALLDTE